MPQRHRLVSVNGQRTWIPVPDDYEWRDNGNRGRAKRTIHLTPKGEREVLLMRIERARIEGRGVR